MVKRWRLQWIIFSFTCAVLLLFLLVAGLLSNWYARKVITETVSQNSMDVLEQINKMIGEQLTSIETMAVSIIMNPMLGQHIVGGISSDPYDQVVKLQSIESIFTEYETMRSDISRISLYTDAIPLYKYKLAWGSDSLLGMDTLSYKELEAMMNGMDAGFTPVRTERPSSENNWRANVPEITYYRRYRKFPADVDLGVLSIGIKASRINEKFGSDCDDDQYFLLGKDGVILDDGRAKEVSPEQTVELIDRFSRLPDSKGYELIRLNDVSYIMLYTKPTGHGMRSVQLKPYTEITGGLTALAVQIVLTVMALCAFAVPILWLLSSYFTRSLKSLVRNINQVSEGNFQVTLGEGFSYEIAELNRNFMTMTYRIERLLNRVEEEGERNREAMLNALQYQIDPHFLCNSLDAINWMAIRIHADDISEMLSRVGQFYRLALRGTKDTVSMRDELELLRNYIELQKVCFLGKLTYIEEVDEDVKDLLILRVLLQPILENAFKYAFPNREQNAEIVVSAWREQDTLILKVADNGIGADADLLNASLSTQEGGDKRYGIRNVHWRIMLYYGADYGLKYLPVAKGTVALIIIPAVDGRT